MTFIKYMQIGIMPENNTANIDTGETSIEKKNKQRCIPVYIKDFNPLTTDNWIVNVTILLELSSQSGKSASQSCNLLK